MTMFQDNYYFGYLIQTVLLKFTYDTSFCADPDIMKKLQVDRGAIRFVPSCANIMCPGLHLLGVIWMKKWLQKDPWYGL